MLILFRLQFEYGSWNNVYFSHKKCLFEVFIYKFLYFFFISILVRRFVEISCNGLDKQWRSLQIRYFPIPIWRQSLIWYKVRYKVSEQENFQRYYYYLTLYFTILWSCENNLNCKKESTCSCKKNASSEIRKSNFQNMMAI